MSLSLLSAVAAMANAAGNPVTRIYTATGVFTETAPAGVSSVTITVDGPGGAGRFDNVDFDPGGGGGGARCTKTIAVVPGNTLTCFVAPAVAGRSTNGNGATGAASTVAGAVSGGAVNLSAGPGVGGRLAVGGSSGVATGGSVNTAGQDGFVPDGGPGASGSPGGTSSMPAGTAPGSGGFGKTSGTSGAGARGEIKFVYS